MITEEQIKQAAIEKYPSVHDIGLLPFLNRMDKQTDGPQECFAAGAKWAIEKDDWIEIKEGCEMPKKDTNVLAVLDGSLRVMAYTYNRLRGYAGRMWVGMVQRL